MSEKATRKKSIGVDVRHDEVVQNVKVTLVDRYSGEIREVEEDRSYIPSKKIKPDNGMSKFNDIPVFHRRSSKRWAVLRKIVTPRQYIVADKLASIAGAYDSSLEPLSSDSTVRELAEYLGENKNTIKKDMDRLLELGVVGEFKVGTNSDGVQKYYVFNTFLSFNGDVIQDEVRSLFKDTMFAFIK